MVSSSLHKPNYNHSFIQAVIRLPPKRAAKRKPCEPIGKYETRYQTSATIWTIDEMRVRRRLWS